MQLLPSDYGLHKLFIRYKIGYRNYEENHIMKELVVIAGYATGVILTMASLDILM
jgi:hypothetical protein